MMNYFRAIANKNLLVVFLFGFSSGLPLALVGSTLQAWYTLAGISLLGIGALTLVGQPYVWKFLWAPFLDRFSLFRFGRRRSWILMTQLILAIGLIVMGCLNPAHTPYMLAFVAVGVAFFSATQDIAIDAYRTEILDPPSYGMGASVNTMGYRLANLLSGALALILAEWWGWQLTYFMMATIFLVEIGITLWAPSPTPFRQPLTLREAVVEPWHELWQRPYVVGLLIFIIFYRFCDALALSLNTTFLIREIGFSLTQIGSMAKIAGLSGSLLGALVGGLLFPLFGMFRSLFYFGLLQMTANLTFMWLAAVGKSVTLMSFAMFSDYFAGGMSSVAFVAFIMALCNKQYTATQFALLSAFTAIGRVFIGPLAAWMVEQWGWVWFYFSTFLIGVPALILLVWLHSKINLEAISS